MPGRVCARLRAKPSSSKKLENILYIKLKKWLIINPAV